MIVLVTSTSLCRDRHNPALERLRQAGAQVRFAEAGRPLTADELIGLLADVDAVLAGVDEYTEQVFAAAPRLRIIARYGVGLDRVDTEAAARAGVRVTTTPGANSGSVAELAIGLALSVARGIPRLDEQVRAGAWPRSTGLELAGRTIGILGFGAIGRWVAQIAAGLRMPAVVYDPYVDEAAVHEAGAEPVALAQAFARSSVLSLHLPLTEQTRHIVDAAAIASMPADAIIVNTARGGLIDERAALAALDEGTLFGIALDAYEVEPPRESLLVGHPRVVSTPHAGAHTAEAAQRMADQAVDAIVDTLFG